jgi:hypothetical protein
MDLLTSFLLTHRTEIYYSIILPIAVISVTKFPDPRLFETRWWYPFYYGIFTFVTWVSAAEWNKWGGKLKIPFFPQEPKLSNTPHPLYEAPK